MSVRLNHMLRMIVPAAALALLGCSHEGGTSGSHLVAPSIAGRSSDTAELNAARIALPFDASNFVAAVDNPYFPLAPGTVFSYRAETADGVETNEVEVTHDTKVILGVATTVVRDRVFLEGALKEDTFDWYAQDKEGNVWYLGEDTKEYEGGMLVSTAGSWEAGKDGARAGIIMLAHPRIGDAYRQEDAPGVVADMARVLSLSETVSVPYGRFRGCVQTMDWTPLEPGNRSFKYYASGIGTVLEVTPRGGRERVELTGIER